LSNVHFPDDIEEIVRARERLGFEEIYSILKEIKKRKRKLQKFNGPKIRLNPTTHDEVISKLPFELTESQESALQEIFDDFSKTTPMNRLVNGDVGSGKTVIAALAAWQITHNGLQTALVAPTAVLANQHYATFKKLFGDQVPIHLVTSNTRKDIESLKKDLSKDSDHNDIFIGTHALFHHLELFTNLGFIVIDEQHKFGVEQRELLTKITISEDLNLLSDTKSIPHVLSMSATPIPRSMALTLFGDMEVSSLATKPLGRKKIITKPMHDKSLLEKMYLWIGKEIEENKAQVYVICPLIEDSEKMDMKSAINEFANLQKRYPDYSISLLHGKLKPVEKDAIIKDFIDGKTDILVSTSVVEVGIDNPNATIMIIESAERFGLAQLHQIRGRVGRSDKQSYCFLKTTTGEIGERIEFFANTEDGFKIAEYDLKSRGPGEVYGTLQSGIPNLKIADILDLELIKRVKKYFK
jgi:ATP-dependent DNA helicase RecG